MLTVLVFAAAVTTSSAGVRLVDDHGAPYAWDLDTPRPPAVVQGRITYHIDPRGSRDEYSGNAMPETTAAERGILAWEMGTSRARFAPSPTAATGRNGTDGVNWVGWVDSGLPPLTLAATTITRDGTRLTDMDIEFNDREWSWGTPDVGVVGIADVQSLATHEWGHVLGCDHVPLRASTMYATTEPGVIAFRSLSQDDVALVGSIYPSALWYQTTGAIEGAVDFVGGADDRAIHVVAVTLVGGEPAASTLTRPDGTYRIEGLPRGAYRLIAAPTLPLRESMNAFWQSGSTSFLPTVLADPAGNPGALRPVVVQAGATVQAPPMSVAVRASPLEPNDTLALATPIRVGDGVCARLEGGEDIDWYGFDGAKGERVSVTVLAWGLGSAADPMLRITDSVGITLAVEQDDRPPDPFLHRAEGWDLDVRIAGFELPADGRHHLRVTAQRTDRTTDSFYVLLLTPSSDAPSAALTEVDANPPRIRADGESQSTLVIRPRKETGDLVGAGAREVTVMGDGEGVVSPVTDAGGGMYTAFVTAPTTPGRERFTVGITTNEGTATAIDAVTLVYLGPVVGSRSVLEAKPRRVDVRSDSSLTTQATVRLVPRDAQGELLGPGRIVAFTFESPPPAGTSVGTVTDVGDGSYGATLTAGTAPGTARLAATVDGVAMSGSVAVEFGFAFADVLAQADADLADAAATPGLKRNAKVPLRAAARGVDSAIAALARGGVKAEKQARATTRGAVAKLVAAMTVSRGALFDTGAADEMARALREDALRAIEEARPRIVTGRDQARVDDAVLDVSAGDAAWTAGDLPHAARLWHRGGRRVASLRR